MSVFSDDNGVWGMVGLEMSRFQTLSKIPLEKRTEAFYSINILVFEHKDLVFLALLLTQEFQKSRVIILNCKSFEAFNVRFSVFVIIFCLI